MRALVVEDDPDVGPDVARALEASGYVVELVDNGSDAWFRGDTEDYAIAILDLGLPRLDGLSVLNKWRSAGRSFPVLILSARGDWSEKVEGIEAGADDYLAKPFAMAELLTRVRSLIRRTAGHANPVLAIGALRIDTRRMEASLDRFPLQLSQPTRRCPTTATTIQLLPDFSASSGYSKGSASNPPRLGALILRFVSANCRKWILGSGNPQRPA